MSLRVVCIRLICSVCVASACVSCGNVLQLGAYTDEPAQAGSSATDKPDAQVSPPASSTLPKRECTTNRDCLPRAYQLDVDSGATPANPTICLKSSSRCVSLTSPECSKVTGDYLDDQAIVVGSMFSTSGAQASINLAREKSAILAVDEINMAGGIPVGGTSAGGRPLVLVSCDETKLLSAGMHLVNDLHVPAIIGPNTSQDVLDLSNKLTIGAHTLVISPTAVASSIADLLDDNLTWQIVPTDVQRAPLMTQEIAALEARLRVERGAATLKLSVIYRDDALGQGTRLALNALMFNGKTLSDPINLGANVRVSPYEASSRDQNVLVTANVKFAPDIIVLVGTAEAITQIMVPLENGWTGPPGSRPEYVLIDSSKTPELIEAVTGNADLRHRIRGTGATPDARSVPVNEAFMVSYATRHPDEPANLFGMGPAYDSVYAVAYAVAALRGMPITGPSIAKALPVLAGGGAEVELQSSKVLSAFRKLTEGTPLTVIGTTAPLQWDEHGSVVGGTVELWCIADSSGKPGYASSGVALDLASGLIRGQYVQCLP